MVSLKSLHLCDSELEGGIPKFFGNMCSLQKLGLSQNKLSGQFSQIIQNLSCGCVVNSLEGLYLGWNNFTGPIPHLGGFSSLEALSLEVNRLNGTIGTSLSQLSKLEFLSLDGNSFTGVISETFFSNMSNLQMLFLADNSLALKLSHNWVPLFQLKWLSLASCKMGPHFPKWLQTQNQLVHLDISNVGITDIIPDWFWDLSSKLSYLNLSNNHIKGRLPDLSLRFDGTRIGAMTYERCSNPTIGFGKCIFVSPGTVYYYKYLNNLLLTWKGSENEYKSTLGLVRCLDLSSNKLDGAIPEEIMDLVGLIALNLSRNNLTGPITPKIGELTSLDFLDLSRNLFSGSIPSSLSQLSGLGVLDLSYNNLHLDLSNNHFGGSPVPEFIGSLSRLRYLNLSCGTSLLKVPRPFQYLSGLVYLRLENSNLFSLGSLEWLSHLSSLRHLDLSYINLTKSSDWFQVVAKLRSLKTLVLRSCALPPINPSFIWHFNLSTSIETLDLSDNNLPSSSVYPWLFNLSRNILVLDLAFNSLRGSIPEAFQHMVSLKSLHLTDNELEGGIPKFFGNMCSLNRLFLPHNKLSGELSEMIQNLSGGCTMNSLEGVSLGGNDITGPLPDLGGFSSLKILILGENRLNGTIDKSLSQLLKLESLSLGRNSFTGVISETFFSNMSNLQILYLNENPLTLKLSHDWVPPFQLKSLSLASCKMGPHFPKWLQTQNQLISLDVSNNGISDAVPDWFWDLSIELVFLNLSNNQIRAMTQDKSSNPIMGMVDKIWIFPRYVYQYSYLDNVLLTWKGSEHEYKSTLGLVKCLDLSSNKLDGAIPEEIMDLKSVFWKYSI
ncbi:hypothetical protein WN943_027289 [Citrus x changshan-huyou]